MELLIQLAALLMAFSFTLVRSMNFAPSALSNFELNRLVKQGDSAADYELQRRNYLRLFVASKNLKEILLAAFIVALLVATHQPFVGLLMALGYLLIAQIIASQGWLGKWSNRLQHRLEPLIARWLGSVSGILYFFAPNFSEGNVNIGSKAELLQLIGADNNLLKPKEKEHLLNSLNFNSLKIKDVMVPADKIFTVDISDIVGPLLLDKLHKAGHNVFIVVKKDLQHVKGLLYMRDLVPLDPDLKHVKDAIRPTVHYISSNSKLEEVVLAGLQTGRQLFIVVDDKGKTTGLITLRDSLEKLLGNIQFNKDHVVTDPKKVKSDENSKPTTN